MKWCFGEECCCLRYCSAVLWECHSFWRFVLAETQKERFSLFWRVCGNHAENEKDVFEKHCKISVILLAAEAKIFQKSTHQWQECVEHCKRCLIFGFLD